MDVGEIIAVVVGIIIGIVLLVLGWIFVVKPLFGFFLIMLTNPIFYIVLAIGIILFFVVKMAPAWSQKHELQEKEKKRIYEEKQNTIKDLIDDLADDISLIVKAVEAEKQIEIDILESLEQKIRDFDETLQNFSLNKHLRRDLVAVYKKFHFSKEIVLKDEKTSESVKKYFSIIDDRFAELGS